MKNLRLITRQLLISSVVVWLHTSCNDGPDGGATPLGSCRIHQFGASPDATLYTYDEQGRPSKWTYTIGDLTITTTYTYDAAGYLTASSLIRNDRSPIKAGLPARQTTTSTTYTYTNGRLTGYLAQKTPGSSQGVTSTGTFDYDATGNLTTERVKFKNTSDPAQASEPYTFTDGFQRTWSYSNKKLVDYIAQNGDVDTHPYTIVDGLITSIANSATYTYDSQRRLIKTMIYNQGTLNSYYTMDWDTGKSWRETLPAFKGFPAIQPVNEPGVETMLGADLGALDYGVYGSAGIPKNYTYFASYKNSGVTQLTKIAYNNQLTSQGFVGSTTTTSTTTYPDEPQQTTTRTTTYTYTGCN